MADPTFIQSRVRHSILLLLCSLAMITYIDRAVVSNSKDAIMGSLYVPGEPSAADKAKIDAGELDAAKWESKRREEHNDNWFWLLFAFQLAYALFEVPTGWLGDRFGPRSTLIRIVVWWSFFLGLTGLAGRIDDLFGNKYFLIGFTGLIVIQFLFGMGEAGAFPNISRALYNWFPAKDRGKASGLVWMSARFMGGLTPLIWLLFVDADFLGMTWRQGFAIFAAVAVGWVVVFSWWFRNTPEEHEAVNDAEKAYIAADRPPAGAAAAHPPFRQLFASANMRWICAMYFCINFGWYFLMYFHPARMKEIYKPESPTDKMLLALMIGAPLLVGMAGCYLGGWLTDTYIRRTGDRRTGRRIFGMIGYAGCAVLYTLAIFYRDNVVVFACLLGAMGFFNDLTMSSCWAICQDVGRRYAAMVSGCMNMVGNFGSILTIFVTGSIIKSYSAAGDKSTGYAICMGLYAAVYLIGIYFWYRIDPLSPIIPEEGDPEPHA